METHQPWQVVIDHIKLHQIPMGNRGPNPIYFYVYRWEHFTIGVSLNDDHTASYSLHPRHLLNTFQAVYMVDERTEPFIHALVQDTIQRWRERLEEIEIEGRELEWRTKHSNTGKIPQSKDMDPQPEEDLESLLKEMEVLIKS